MNRQHSVPLLIGAGGGSAEPLTPLDLRAATDAVSEAAIQKRVHEHPACLPIAEIDALFCDPVPICTELRTPAGSIDNFLVTPSGLPVLIECKLWRNPEGRRVVIGQILDYAKELSRWSCSDLQREVSRRLRREGNPVLEMVRAVHPDVDEIEFNDAVTSNLRRGRFLLLIVGDGIREGVEAISEYLQQHAGLHFSLGLVELPTYALPNGDRLVVPRILARTTIITRNIVALPDGYGIHKPEHTASVSEIAPEHSAVGDEQRQFWEEFLDGLKLDDPEQPMAKAARLGYITFSLPVRTSWLTVYRDLHAGKVGIFLSSWRNTPGADAMQAIVQQWDAIKNELGGTAERSNVRDGRQTISDSFQVGPLDKTDVRDKAFRWLRERVNTFINVLRPRMRAEAADYTQRVAQ